jgi:hypothetical protein
MAKRKGKCLKRRVRNGVSRCIKRAAKRSGGSTTRRKRSGYRRRRPVGMARKGSKCTRFKRVRVKGRGTQRRCVKYGR